MAVTTVRTLDQLAEGIFLGVNLTRLPRSPTKTPKIRVIRVKDIVEDQVVPMELLDQVPTPSSQQLGRQRLQLSDVLISARGTLFKCALVSPSHVGAIASANFIVVRLKGEHLAPEILWSYLRLSGVQQRILSGVSWTVQPALNVRDLASLKIPLPSPAMQHDLTNLILLADEQYRAAMVSAKLRKDEAQDILAQQMGVTSA